MLSLKQSLRDGQTLIGTWLNAPSPSQAEIIGYAGFDFVVLDTEHSSYDLDTAEHLVRAADAAQLPSLLRVSENTGAAVAKALDSGAQGVVVSHVSTAEDARRAVRHAHYAPHGVRGAAPTVRATRYGQISWPDYVAHARSHTLVVLQIEGKQGLANLDEIMAAEGIDVLFVGPFDLSESLGISGQLDHPALLRAVGEIVERARARSIALGIWMPTPEQTFRWIERGVQIVTVANNDMIFAEACRAIVRQVRSGMGQSAR
jgi:4-hydroxy-2-oxoheptanedioate aldolase